MAEWHHHSIIGVGLTVLLAGGAARGDAPTAPSPGAQVAWALHLLGQARYGEAADAAQALAAAEPSAAPAYELRGALALYVGDFARAQDDFRVAALHAPQEPAVRYGLGLCALAGRRWDAADAEFAQARQAPGLTPAQGADLDTARAYVAFLRGQGADAARLPAPAGDDPMRQELLAMVAARDRSDSAETLLTQFLATPSGVPRVREDDGVRGLFDAAAPVEASVTEPLLQRIYAARLGDSMAAAARAQGRAAAVSGTVALRARGAERAALVSFSIDGQGTALLNSAPFVYVWDTTRVVNGAHVIQIEADDAGGKALATQTQTVRVENAHSTGAENGQGDFTAADYAQTQAGVWGALRLRPARKAAQWALAGLLAARGDTAGADAHRLVAAALDPGYKTGRHAARLALGASPHGAPSVPPPVRVAAARPLSLWRGDATRRQVALTFDDGPNPDKTPALLDALDKAGATATFFVVGARAEAAPDLVRRMARAGDEVENHSYTHPNMDQADPDTVEEELLRNCVVVQSLTGRAPRFFRPPGGNGGPAVMALAGDYGLTGAFWTLDALPAEDLASAPGLAAYVLGRVHPGSIVLMHNAPDVTTAAIPAIVAGLRARGYRLVTLAELARHGAASKNPAAVKPEKE